MTESRSSVKFLDGFLLLALALIWGSSFILMKKGLVAFPALQLAGIRVFISFLFLSPFLIPAFRSIKKNQIAQLLIISLLGSGIPAILYAFSLTRVDSSVAGIINSMVPLFTLVIGLLFFRIKFVWSKIIGVLIGLAGAAILVMINSEGGISSIYGYALLPVLATLFYGTNTNLLKKYFNEIDPIHLAALIYMVVGIPGGIYILFTDFNEILFDHEHGMKSLGYIAVLSTLGSAFGMILFAKLIQRTSALFSSTVTYLIPIVAILWGLLDGEKLGWFQVGGTLFILTGVYIVNRSFYRGSD